MSGAPCPRVPRNPLECPYLRHAPASRRFFHVFPRPGAGTRRVIFTGNARSASSTGPSSARGAALWQTCRGDAFRLPFPALVVGAPRVSPGFFRVSHERVRRNAANTAPAWGHDPRWRAHRSVFSSDVSGALCIAEARCRGSRASRPASTEQATESR